MTSGKKKTNPQKIADRIFSRYIRLRDSTYRNGSWHGKCITCSKKGVIAYYDENKVLRFVRGWDAGHFISRGNLYLRYDEENVNLQCSYHCNKMKSGNIEKYRGALDDKYGSGTWKKLTNTAEENKDHRLLKADYEETIHDSTEMFNFIIRNP